MGQPDPNVDFDAALSAAVERQRENPPEPDGGGIESGEPEPTPYQYERPRDEQGRFVAAEDDSEDEYPDELERFRASPTAFEQAGREPLPTVDEPEPEEAPEEQFDRLYSGKFQSAEELERGYGELESTLGRQADEIGQLRQTVSQLMQQQQPQTGPQQIPTLSEDQIEELVSDPNVAGRFVHDLYRQNHPSFRMALNKWAEYAPGDVSLFTADVRAQQMRAEYDAAVRPLQAAEKQQQWLDSWAELSTTYTDMGDFGQAMLDDLTQNPNLTAPIQAGLPDAEATVIENLYLRAKARQQPQAVAAQQQAAERQQAMRRNAHVARGGATPARAASGPADAVQKLKESILRYDRGQSVHDAITRRD